MSERVIAQMEGVTRRYGTVTALNSFDLSIQQGEVVALLGPNGAGKTTAVNLLLGLLRPDQGAVRVFGRAPHSNQARTRLGAMLQVSNVPETMRVREHIDLFRCYYPNPMDADDIIGMAGLEGIENRYFGKLSGGQKQRVLFALAMCGDPELLFLDEPTVGLDVESRRRFWSTIRNFVSQERTVVLTTHYLEEADALADRIVVIDSGERIAHGTPAEIKSRTAARRVRFTSTLAERDISAIPGVVSVRRNGVFTDVLTGDAEAVTRILLERDRALSNLEIGGAGLEEAFLSITGEARRDEKEEAA